MTALPAVPGILMERGSTQVAREGNFINV